MGVYDVTTSSRTVHKCEMSFRTELLNLLSLSNQNKHGQSLGRLFYQRMECADHWMTHLILLRSAGKQDVFFSRLT